MDEPTVGNMTISQLEEVITRIATSVILSVDLNQNTSFRAMREDLQSQISNVDQKVETLDKRVGALDEKVGHLAHHMNQKFDEVHRIFDQKFDEAEATQNEILNAIEERFEDHGRWITSLERAT